MIKYKYIHKDSGYESLFSITDSDLCNQIKWLIEDVQKNISSKNGEKIYAYIYNEKQSIYYKEFNSLVNSLIDNNNVLRNNFSQSYTTEIIFNDALLPIDNAPINPLPIRPASMMVPNIPINDLMYIPMMVDALLNNKKVALIGSNIEQLKNFVKFVLYLFPVSFSRKIGYILNLAYVPDNLYQEIFNNVNIFGLTNDNGAEGLDVVINLNQPYNKNIQLSPFAKVLDFDKMNSLQLQRRSKELFNLFDSNGNYIETKAKKDLTLLIFEREKNAVNADLLLDVLLETTEPINLNSFRNLANFILTADIYIGEIAEKIDSLIARKPELRQFEMAFKEKTIQNNLEDLTRISDQQVQEIIEILSNDNIQLKEDYKEKINNQKTNLKTNDIIFNILIKSNDNDKLQFCVDYLNYDRTYNIIINNISFDEFICLKIFKLNNENEIVKVSTAFLYSIIKYGNNNDNQVINRKNQFIKYLKQLDSPKVSKIDLIFKIYKSLNDLIKIDIPEQISNLYNFELFTNVQLNSIIEISKDNENNEYKELIEYVLANQRQTYNLFYKEILNLVLNGKSKNDTSKYLYEKYITVYNYKMFEDVLNISGDSNHHEYINFLNSLKNEETISNTLAPYRLDYIYNSYINSPVVIKKKIAKRLHLAYNENTDKTIRGYVYNIDGQEDSVRLHLQKQTIDLIIDYAEVNDSMSSSGKSNHYRKIITSLIISLFFSIFSLAIFNIPVFVKLFLLNEDFLLIFFEYNNMITPYIFLYCFVIFLIFNLINVGKTRGNELQALGRTLINWLLYVLVPILMYIIAYLITYFTI